MTPTWVTAFLDLAPEEHEAGLAHWQGVTGYAVSQPRGDDGEFATLLPSSGDAHLKVQRLGAGPSRIHVDLHVADLPAALDEARALGAGGELHPLGYAVLASPGGLTFCLVTHPASRRAPAATWPGGHTSLVDQVCVDVPARGYDAECAFWEGLTGWPLVPAGGEFRRLLPPPDQPVRLLLQRLDEQDGPARAHLDLATSDRAAETERHLALGARVVTRREHWTVLAAPGGPPYCLTDRDPATGRAPA